MKSLLPMREPVYAEADVTVASRDEPHDTIVDEIFAGLARHLDAAGKRRSYDDGAVAHSAAAMNRPW